MTPRGVWALALVVACGGAPPTDYAAARRRFHSHLIKQAPSPQAWHPSTLPDDAHAVAYESGGLHLAAWLARPAGEGAHPAVLFLHGGAAFDADDWQMTEPFRAAGFVVMTPLLRGENGQPGSYSMFYDEVDDVLAAAEVLARQPGVDPRRIYLAGHSAGATIALLAAEASPRFRAAAAFSGDPDFESFARLPGGDAIIPYARDPVEPRMRSALVFATSFQCPARLFWGDEESPQLATANRATAARAAAAGKDVVGVEVPGDHHTMVAPATARAIAFFQAH